VVASAGGTGYGAARGTSFAAPVVAALIAAMLQEPDAAQAARGIEQLVSQAIDLGAPGRDTVFGHGLVGVDPR
jgi:subtilisin family serine protease